ncbi:MAG: hypothetical protein WBD31_29835 [Rubripirellula sp.]
MDHADQTHVASSALAIGSVVKLSNFVMLDFANRVDFDGCIDR